MKTKRNIILLSILALAASWTIPTAFNGKKAVAGISAKEKTSPMFSYIRTHRQGRDGVNCSWACGAGSGANQFVLQRTYEYPDEYATWENIHQCNANARNTFSYQDDYVFPGVINYRVIAMNGGTPLFCSEISSIQIRQR
jgi:hypothetical protein